jgi:hypothetical protein
MKFAKTVFWIAGIWGLLVITPLVFIFDLIGKNDPPPITHPGFYYGFATVTLAFQIVFIVIARDPVRLRPIMVPSVIEKFSYGIAVVTLYSQGRMKAPDLMFVAADTILGALFVVAYVKTKDAKSTGIA